MKEYNRTAHIMAIEHEIWALRWWLQSGVPIMYSGVEIMPLNAQQTIGDLEEELNKLIKNNKICNLKSTD